MPGYGKGSLGLPDGDRIPYLTLGDGPVPLLFVPGAGDGLATVADAALRLAFYFRKRLGSYRMLLLSRRQPIPPGFTAEQHADDCLWAAERLGWGPSVVECNSAGGPIGQWVATKRPEMVRALILSCSLHRTSEHTRELLEYWTQLARDERWYELYRSGIEHTYRSQTVDRYRPLFPLLLRLLSRPRHPERIERVFEGLFGLDNRPVLPRISRPALVIGGEDDRVVPAQVQREMAALIPESRLVLYPGYGHGNDQESPDYARQVDLFVGNL